MTILHAVEHSLTAHRRPLALLAVVVLTVSLIGINALASYDRVRYAGGSIGGDTPLLLGFSADTTSGSGTTTIFYAYQPHGELRVQLALQNDGDRPIVVSAVERDEQLQAWTESIDVRLPPAPTMDILPLYPSGDGSPWYSEPFRPFELPPHTGTTFALRIRLADCSAYSGPVPTRVPGATPQIGYSGGTGLSLDSITVDYSVDGVARTTLIRLPEAIVVVESGPDTFGCGRPGAPPPGTAPSASAS